jgi:hypothetical protein
MTFCLCHLRQYAFHFLHTTRIIPFTFCIQHASSPYSGSLSCHLPVIHTSHLSWWSSVNIDWWQMPLHIIQPAAFTKICWLHWVISICLRQSFQACATWKFCYVSWSPLNCKGFVVCSFLLGNLISTWWNGDFLGIGEVFFVQMQLRCLLDPDICSSGILIFHYHDHRKYLQKPTHYLNRMTYHADAIS